jgi:hypothetical protein
MASDHGDDQHQNEEFQFELDSAAVRRGGEKIICIETKKFCLTNLLNIISCEHEDSNDNGWKTIEQMQKGSADGIEGMGQMRRIVRYFAVMALLTSSAAIAFVMLYNNVSSLLSMICCDLARLYVAKSFF